MPKILGNLYRMILSNWEYVTLILIFMYHFVSVNLITVIPAILIFTYALIDEFISTKYWKLNLLFYGCILCSRILIYSPLLAKSLFLCENWYCHRALSFLMVIYIYIYLHILFTFRHY